MQRALAILIVLNVLLLSSAQAQDKAKIDPKADVILKKMCETVAGLKQFSFDSEAVFDEVLPSGQKIQLSTFRKVTIQRPNRLKAIITGDIDSRVAAYKGTTLALYDPKNNVFATATVPDKIDKMFDELHKKYGVTLPLTDLLFEEPYKILTEHVLGGGYVGLHYVGEVKCHHLAFRQRSVDWQIWIDAGERALPLKMIITYKELAAQPQHVSILSNWNVNPKITDTTFDLAVPEGVKKIDMDKLFSPQAIKPD